MSSVRSWPFYLVLFGLFFMGGCLGSFEEDCAATATCIDELVLTDASVTEEASIDGAPDSSPAIKSEAGVESSAPLPVASPCSNSAECATGHCVDGLCCNTLCDGVCERCDANGSEGQCSPIEAGLDPDSECKGAGDGQGPCAGSCDGSGACSFPDESTSCGERSCADGAESAEVCNGAGACEQIESDCGLYVCGEDRCQPSCSSDADCADGAYCFSEQCLPQKPLGQGCNLANECQSGICAGGFCCSSACQSPNSCETGECLCGGKTCSTGQNCITWFLDADGDGYPASSENDVIACANAQPPNKLGRRYYNPAFVPLDCDDDDPDAHPGQTKFFTKPGKKVGWDYDCDGEVTQQYLTGMALTQCSACKDPVTGICSVGFGLTPTSCKQSPGQFTDNTVNCGQSAELRTCKMLYPVNCGGPFETSASTATQGCR